MALEHLLSQKRAAILDRWLQLIIESYPADSSIFLKQEKDRFVNPVGYTISQEIASIYGMHTGLEKFASFSIVVMFIFLPH